MKYNVKLKIWGGGGGGASAPKAPPVSTPLQSMGVDTVYNVGGLNDHCAQRAQNVSTLLLKMS